MPTVTPGSPYIDVDALKRALHIAGTEEDELVDRAVRAASRAIDDECGPGRTFTTATVATARVFVPSAPSHVTVDDFWTTDGLIVEVDTAGDGTWATTLASADWTPWPHNPQPGRPYTAMLTTAGASWPNPGMRVRRPTVRVTAKWGWAAVPAPIEQATQLVAAKLFRRRDTELGVVGVSSEFGAVRVPASDPQVRDLLQRYMRRAVAVA